MYVYKHYSALNSQQWLICHKTSNKQTNKKQTNKQTNIYTTEQIFGTKLCCISKFIEKTKFAIDRQVRSELP